MTSKETIEIVARAIGKKCGGGLSISDHCLTPWEEYHHLAIAAIKAYKEQPEYKQWIGANVKFKAAFAVQNEQVKIITDLENKLKIADKEIDVLLNKYCQEKDKLKRAREALQASVMKFSDVREEWWGQEGFKTVYVTEAMLQQTGESMVEEATEGYKIAEQALKDIDLNTANTTNDKPEIQP